MKSYSVHITDYIDNPCIERDILGDALSTKISADIEVLLVWHKHITPEYISQFPNLKAVVRYGVGYDNIDLEYTNSKGIFVCNTPDYGVDEVSDTAVAMILNIARGVTRYDYLSRGYGKNWQENTIASIKRTSKTIVGVVGAGRIGGSVLLKCAALGFDTVFFDPYKASGHEKMLNARRVESLEELLADSDIVSLHAPLSDETRGMVKPEFFALMKEGASLVNTARGGLIAHLDDFYEPLKSGRLACASLDVIPDEPPPEKGLMIEAWRTRSDWLDGRFIINPHTAYFSDSAYYEMRSKAAQNALRVLQGCRPINIVNGL